ncbi:MAG: hypothetical protein CSA95_01275 [Bacteroidetes bacterium]|nr:MAG: hypothetical protein CSA95_01275 [Bacteroidota bacterium]PIE88192.1 MAG: hypothetical protein CSA04_03070 [Bacteroidota bacterium]
MKNRILLLLLLIGFTGNLWSQSEALMRKYTNNFDIFTDIWTDVPEGMEIKAINLGYNISSSYIIPIEGTHFGVLLGLGITGHNLYSNSVQVDVTDASGKRTGEVKFVRLDSIMPEVSYSRNKIALTYAEVPFEVRYYHEKSGVKVSTGIRIGFLLDSHSKYRGDDYLLGSEDVIRFKKKDLHNVSEYRFTPFVRVGWKWVNVTASYGLTGLYEQNKGPQMHPISLGLSFTPFH